jgi:hypothetical protein
MNPIDSIRPQPPPLRAQPSNGLWNKAALLLGAAAYVAVVYRFQTYTQRNNMPTATYEIFAVVMFLLGFGVGLFATASRVRAATFLIVGVFLLHSVIIWVDWQEDPTNHNLLPFEFIYLGFLGSPAYIGALLAQLVTRT